MRCLTCRYSLKYLTEHRCPECGRVFDPNDPRTVIGPRIGPQLRWALVLISVVFVFALIVIATFSPIRFWLYQLFYACGATLVIAPMLWLGYVFVMAVNESRPRRD